MTGQKFLHFTCPRRYVNLNANTLLSWKLITQLFPLQWLQFVRDDALTLCLTKTVLWSAQCGAAREAAIPGVVPQELPGDLPEGGRPPQRSRQLTEVLRTARKVAVIQVVLLIEAGARHLHRHIYRHRWLRGRVRSPAADEAHRGGRMESQWPLRETCACFSKVLEQAVEELQRCTQKLGVYGVNQFCM